MLLTLMGLGAVSLLELTLWLPFMWRVHKSLASLVVPLLILISIAVVVAHTSLWTGILFLLSLYRVVNLLRLVRGKTLADYLYRVARASSFWLIGLQLLVLAGAKASTYLSVSALQWWEVVAVLQIAAVGVLLASTIRHLATTQPLTLTTGYADRDLPSLTVAIPARNETEDLAACLASLVASDYRKLEILVLDDCSQNKRTPEIIRSFAHSGVRFIAGEVPSNQWLAKNYAYAQLAKEANGDMLLFCGVDARFSPSSLRQLVEIMLEKKKTMLSVIPSNSAPPAWNLEALMVQPARYAWELALPRRWLNRPPILSTCWLIDHTLLNKSGGFEAVSRSISPESFLARYAATQDDGYSFMQSSPQIGISSAKSFDEQRATAIRTRYPQLHRRPELVGLLSLLELLVLTGPFVGLIIGVVGQHWLYALLCLIACGCLVSFYSKIVTLTYRQFLWRGLWLLPFVCLYDLVLLNYSLYQYEFREVIWKGRNICLPVMRVIPKLPPL